MERVITILCLLELVLGVLQAPCVLSVPHDHHSHHRHKHAIMWPHHKQKSYQTHFIKLKVDHFSFTNSDAFQLRYLVNSDYWDSSKPTPGPIFFYTGNEGDITVFSNNTGLMWDLAPAFGAMLVFAEHRYYGVSKPYGPEHCCKNVSRLGYLTSEQALADYAELIGDLTSRWSHNHSSSPAVVAFGGSYGGMLAAWMRTKYPHIVHGAIAASAPVSQFTGITPCNRFNQVTSRTFSKRSANPACAKLIRKSWNAIDQLVKTGAAGEAHMSTLLRLCQPAHGAGDVGGVKAWLGDALTSLAMVDYPYPTNFLAPLPAWPVKVACSHLPSSTATLPDTLLPALARAVGVFYNHTGQAGPCFNTSISSGSAIGADLWAFQACTEMVMPMCSDGREGDMFPPRSWNLTREAAACREQWGPDVPPPEPFWVPTHYGATPRDFARTATNIIFTNGMLDPWSSGGISQNVSDTVLALTMSDGAHHLDLRPANPADPPDVRAVRNTQRRYIRKWIQQHHIPR